MGGLKMNKLIRYSVAVSLMLFISLIAGEISAAEFRGISSHKITGSWKFKDSNDGPQKITFLKDGTYNLDFDGDGKRDIWGSYRISQDWIILNDVGGDFVFDCGQQGAYSFRINDDILTFTMMADQCPSRSQAMSVQWARAIEPKRIIETPIMMKI